MGCVEMRNSKKISVTSVNSSWPTGVIKECAKVAVEISADSILPSMFWGKILGNKQCVCYSSIESNHIFFLKNQS